MTFRNTASLFFIFLSLLSCKGVQYYRSGTNPAGVSVILNGPDTYYWTEFTGTNIGVSVINHNSQPITITNWWNDLSIVGKSRFYQKELYSKMFTQDPQAKPIVISPGDTVEISFLPPNFLLTKEKTWTYKNKPCLSPHLMSLKKAHPYIYLSAELNCKVINQSDIKVRSNTIKINIAKWNEPKLVNKKTELSITSDVRTYSTKTKDGNLICKITNTGTYPIPLFNDPGAVRFRIFAYNPNRTAIMYTQYILDNGKLPVDPVSIAAQSSHTITIPISQLLFTERPESASLFWTWNKKDPPVSPLVYGKKDMAMSTELWFGVVVDGQEFLSNTVSLNIDSPNKKTKKSQ